MIAKFLLTTNQKPDDIKVDLNSSNIDSILAPQDGGTLTRIISGSEQRIYVVRKGYNEKRKAFFKNISIDDIRNLQSYCSLSIADGGRRVIIIDTADDLNSNSCNALLKLLEEPPKNTLFLLISHQPNLLLPTLQSRCQKLLFSALSQNDLRAVVTTTGQEIGTAQEDDDELQEVSSEKQRRWACAQKDKTPAQRPDGLSAAEAEEMCTAKIEEDG